MANPVTIRLDRRVLDRIIRESPAKADRVVSKIAFDLQRDVNDHWTTSPSSPGEPPGVVTGALKNSAQVGKLSDRKWRLVYAIIYAAMLEYGTRNMAARPFLQPAAERLGRHLADYFKDVIE